MENLDKLKLLIVDDDKDLLRQLEFLLEDDFREVFVASSKQKALESASDHIDVFLVDVRLDEGDPDNKEGLELVKEIRKKSTTAVIIMMSRYHAEKYEALARQEAKADGFIRKPFTMDDFIELVEKICKDKESKQKFCGGSGGNFSKEPPGRRRREKNHSTKEETC